jgi:hypothetical protein
VPPLSEGWQGSFRELLAKADRDTPTAPAWTGFQPLRVAEIRRESSTITSFLLVPTRSGPGCVCRHPWNLREWRRQVIS